MSRWKKPLWAGLCLMCLLALGLMRHGDSRSIAALTPQLAARRWETAEKPYALVSVFLEPENALDPGRMGEIYLSVENSLTAGGVGSDTHPWYYAASCHRDAVLRGETASCDVELTAVAGEFFRLHPLPLRSGFYPAPEDVMRDKIVLDRRAAWDLFYSDNVAGMFVELEGRSYQVAAVVDLEPGHDNALAAGDIRRAWAFADGPGMEEAQLGFTCLEMVLPQPVRDFAGSTLKTAIGSMVPDKTAITDNSLRFSLRNRWSVLRHLGTRGISAQAVAYPYWENAARLTENRLALRLIPEGLLAAVPLISLGILLWRLNRRRTWGLHSIRDKAAEALDKKHQRDYALAHTDYQPELPPAREAEQSGGGKARQTE